MPLTQQLSKSGLYASAAPLHKGDMPEPALAAESIYIPLLHNQLNIDRLPHELPAGLHISSLAEAQQKYPELLRRHLFSTPLRAEDGFVLLNEAAFEYGLFVYVEEGATIDRPLLLHHHTSSRGAVSHPRLFVYLEAGASLQLIEMQSSSSDAPSHQNAVSEFFCSTDAKLHIYKLQEDAPHHLRIDHTYVAQAARARVWNYVFSHGGASIRNNLYFHLLDPETKAHLQGLYICDGRSRIDNHSSIDHCAPESQSEQCYQGILGQRGQGVFNGRIFMRAGSTQARAYQSNKNLLLSDQAKLHTKPQLEIWVDDVRCSHGCTVGQLAPEQLHYLQSRGIPKTLAQELLLYAFGEAILSGIEQESLRTYLSQWLSTKCRSTQT